MYVVVYVCSSSTVAATRRIFELPRKAGRTGGGREEKQKEGANGRETTTNSSVRCGEEERRSAIFSTNSATFPTKTREKFKEQLAAA